MSDFVEVYPRKSPPDPIFHRFTQITIDSQYHVFYMADSLTLRAFTYLDSLALMVMENDLRVQTGDLSLLIITSSGFIDSPDDAVQLCGWI